MPRHDASIADQEATEHFDDVPLTGDEVTDEHSQGVFDEVDLFGSLAPATERTRSATGETSVSGALPVAPVGMTLLAGLFGVSTGVALVGGITALAFAALLWTEPPTPREDPGTELARAEVLAPIPREQPAPVEPIAEPELRDVLKLEPRRVPVDFAHDSYAVLTGPAFAEFARTLRDDLARAERRELTLVGHTDSTGSDEVNRTMGLGRAWAVEVALMAQGFADEQIALRSAGEREPIADNRTAEGRAANRRVVATFE